MQNNTNSILVIAGPTAVGKTALSIDIAKALNTQIISADSRQCYQELSIGVAKPSIAQLNAVHHYFIGSHSILEEVNAGMYEQYALQSAETIFKQNPIAVLTGGTGLYINAFCNGIDAMPAIDPAIRAEIIGSYQQHGLQWLQEQVKLQDPAFWQVAEQQNPQRLMRALEFVRSTGSSITLYRKGEKAVRPFRIIKIALTRPKESLLHNINLRVDQMMEEGLLKEVEALLPYQHLNALQTVGYNELFNYFNGTCTLKEAIEQIKVHTRQYAKRQLTMFRRNDDYHWIDLDSKPKEAVIEEILQRIQI